MTELMAGKRLPLDEGGTASNFGLRRHREGGTKTEATHLIMQVPRVVACTYGEAKAVLPTFEAQRVRTYISTIKR